MKQILVTGGAGILGSHLCDKLLAAVRDVLCVEVGQIYSLACPASPVHYQQDPVQTTKTSVHGAINMLGLAKRTKARILQAPTSEVYGDPEVHPQREGYGAGSIQWARAAVMTKANVAPRSSFSTTGVSIGWKSRSCGSSTPMVRACIGMTDAW